VIDLRYKTRARIVYELHVKAFQEGNGDGVVVVFCSTVTVVWPRDDSVQAANPDSTAGRGSLRS
jgi:hypothetical protein